jgi:NAD(P)-dependent dehydrogenase (short-subunit alcohol dehydrogenase family)
MRASSVLVTGANGEIGHGLLTRLAAEGRSIVTLDIQPLEPALARDLLPLGPGLRAPGPPPRLDGPGLGSAVLAPALSLGLGH